MAERPVLLIAAAPVRRDDKTPEADQAMAAALLAHIEGPDARFEVWDPYEATGAVA